MPDELSAAVLLDACDHARSLERAHYAPLGDLSRAETLQADIRVARLARGERPVGYKIGFTNRTIWPLYGVFQPIWAPLWNTTVDEATVPAGADSAASARLPAARFIAPRLEPEIVVGLRDTPLADTPEAVLAATSWIAHGFEIVQSPYPDWRFTAAEAFAAQALHGALVVGPRQPVSILGGPPAQALARLADFEIDLLCDGRLVAQGRGANVLDGPLHAIAHLARELRRRGQSIAPGSLITTGTLTDAQPLRRGQRWTSRLLGLPLPGLCLDVD